MSWKRIISESNILTALCARDAVDYRLSSSHTTRFAMMLTESAVNLTVAPLDTYIVLEPVALARSWVLQLG